MKKNNDRRISTLIDQAKQGQLVHPEHDKPALYPDQPDVLHQDDAFLLSHLECLRSDLAKGLPLSPDDREVIIALIDNYVLPARRGAPLRAAARGPWEQACQYVATLVRIRKNASNRQRIRDAEEFFQQTIHLVEQRCPELRDLVQLPRDTDAIRKYRPSVAMLNYVRQLFA
jgi:hypothetical protein